MISEKLQKAITGFEATIQKYESDHWVATASKGRSRARVALIEAIEAEIKTERDAATVAAIKQCMKDIRGRM